MQKITDLIRSVRLRINDSDSIGFDDSELIDYINGGIQWLHRLILRERPELIAEEEVLKTEPFTLSKKPLKILEAPEGFLVRMNGTIATAEKGSIYVRYVPDMGFLANTDDFPYYQSFADMVVEFATIRAQLRNEFSMGDEMGIFSQLESQVVGVIQGIQSDRSDIDGYYPVRRRSDDYGGIE